jgi:hypothetical protein
MDVSDEEFLAAIDELKKALRQLRKCKPSDSKRSEGIVRTDEAAAKTIDKYLDEHWPQRFQKRIPPPRPAATAR